MSDLFTATTSKGKLTITENSVNIRLAGSERTIARAAISEVRISLGPWLVFGFLRTLTLIVAGERRPIVLANMSKSKALAAKSILGF
jgi:hypothetical protein